MTVISGKGGTGKTTLTAAFASLSANCVVADCDVDAPDLHLLLGPKIKQAYLFTGGKSGQINELLCIKCGICLEQCQFEAVTADFRIETLYCEGCGLCASLCPAQAIELMEKASGEWYISQTRVGSMVHARLGPGEDNSGKLVAKVRETACQVAEAGESELILIDGPPGIGCPAIAAITGADYALIVTEPTMSGLHDLKRAVELIRHFGVKTGVCVNKFDLNQEMTEKIKDYLRMENLDFLGRIPFDPAVTTAMVKGQTINEHGEGPAVLVVRAILDKVKENLQIN